MPLALSFGGGKGIRTLVGLLPNGFQDRLVMTTSISLRKGIQFQSLEKILEKTLERMMRRRRKILKVKEIQGFFEVCFRYDKKFSRPPRYDRFDTSPYMKLSFDRNHQIFNCFRNSFRNALLCCCRSAEKVRCCKAFQGFCDRCARKFSRPPRYGRCVVHRRSRYNPLCIKAACAVYAGFHVNVAFLLRGAELPLPYCITKRGKCQVFFGRSGKKGR